MYTYQNYASKSGKLDGAIGRCHCNRHGTGNEGRLGVALPLTAFTGFDGPKLYTCGSSGSSTIAYNAHSNHRCYERFAHDALLAIFVRPR